MKNTTLHVKVSPETAKNLKSLSRKREIPVGELIRRAIDICYQLEVMQLPDRQRKAITAYQGGYISIGKLAEEMGMTAVSVRHWLNDRSIAQNNVLSGAERDYA